MAGMTHCVDQVNKVLSVSPWIRGQAGSLAPCVRSCHKSGYNRSFLVDV